MLDLFRQVAVLQCVQAWSYTIQWRNKLLFQLHFEMNTNIRPISTYAWKLVCRIELKKIHNLEIHSFHSFINEEDKFRITFQDTVSVPHSLSLRMESWPILISSMLTNFRTILINPLNFSWYHWFPRWTKSFSLIPKERLFHNLSFILPQIKYGLTGYNCVS